MWHTASCVAVRTTLYTILQILALSASTTKIQFNQIYLQEWNNESATLPYKFVHYENLLCTKGSLVSMH